MNRARLVILCLLLLSPSAMADNITIGTFSLQPAANGMTSLSITNNTGTNFNIVLHDGRLSNGTFVMFLGNPQTATANGTLGLFTFNPANWSSLRFSITVPSAFTFNGESYVSATSTWAGIVDLQDSRTWFATVEANAVPQPVPEPASILLLASGLLATRVLKSRSRC